MISGRVLSHLYIDWHTKCLEFEITHSFNTEQRLVTLNTGCFRVYVGLYLKKCRVCTL